MSQYYNSKRSSDWNYGGKNWKLSRSKIDLFLECRRCFFIDNKYGVARPKLPSFTLNVAVDALLKKEFDIHRAKNTPHPLMKKYGIDAIPFSHKEMDAWRENFVGIQYPDPVTGFLITGAIDDIWVNPKGELIVVDYKATSKDGKIEKLENSGWEREYKRQMEVYQWLLRNKGFEVSETGYFVYVNGRKDKDAFDGKLEFDVTVISNVGNDSWIAQTLLDIKACLTSDDCPDHTTTCDYCSYWTAVTKATEIKKEIGKEVAHTTPKISQKSSPKTGKRAESPRPTLF